MRGSNSIPIAACSHKPQHLHPFSFHQSDAARCQFGLQRVIKSMVTCPSLPDAGMGFTNLISHQHQMGPSCQLDLVCNGKAVNAAVGLQITCSGAGEQNRNLIDRIWKRESRRSSESKRLRHSDVHYRECNWSRTDTVWGFPFVFRMYVIKPLKSACSYFQTSTSHTMDCGFTYTATDGYITGPLLQPDFWQHAPFRWFMAAVLGRPVDTFAIVRTIS